jgi:NAD(P)-dependent dehydrogenase (short-subunit alcohol dehydrogenase family)
VTEDGRSPLAGRVAVVTGATRGIGRATATRLADAGARVVALARGRDALDALVQELGRGALAVPCDLADRDAVARATDALRAALGAAPDLLVSNAGLFEVAAVEDTTVETFARTLDTNLLAPFLLLRAMLPGMRARGTGHVVTVGSIADRNTFPGNGAYAASKYGARALHEVLRAELRGSGVRASLVSPGPTDTPLWDPIGPDEREGFTPRARMLPPDAVADAILWVATRPPETNVDELRLSRA